MALLHKSFFRLSISNVFLPYKTFVYNRLSTSAPLCKVTVEEKLGIKPRPKRPKSSFLRFLSQIKPQILQDNPKASITEINRIAGERWRVADEKIKTDLSDEFKADWSKYLEQVKTYERALSPIQKEEIQKANETVSVNKKKKKLRQQMEQLGKPKRPASTFVMFMLTKVQERGDTPFKEWQQKVTKEWETTSVAVKDQLNETYQKEMENYRQELEKWERKMQREGHKELIDKKRQEDKFSSRKGQEIIDTKVTSEIKEKEDIISLSVESKHPPSVPSRSYRLFKIVCLITFTFCSLVLFINGSNF